MFKNIKKKLYILKHFNFSNIDKTIFKNSFLKQFLNKSSALLQYRVPMTMSRRHKKKLTITK